jgi:sugar lactone lactonase YvrE
MKVSRCAPFAIVAALSLAGCSGNSLQPTPNAAAAPVSPSSLASRSAKTQARYPQRSWIDGAALKAGAIYISDIGGMNAGCIEIYALKGHNQQPSGQICEGAANQGQHLATDRHGNLWVSRFYQGQIVAYAPGATTPFVTLNDPGYQSDGVAVDDKDNVYVANYGTASNGPGNVVIYAKGATNPTQTLSDPAFGAVSGVTVDSAHDVFVSYGVSSIGEFARSASGYSFSTPVTGGASNPPYTPDGLALDDAGGLVVADQGADASFPPVEVYSRQTWALTNVFGGPNGATCLAFKRKSRSVLVAEPNAFGPSGGAVYEFSYPRGRTTNTITAGLAHPACVAVWPRSPVRP